MSAVGWKNDLECIFVQGSREEGFIVTLKTGLYPAFDLDKDKIVDAGSNHIDEGIIKSLLSNSLIDRLRRSKNHKRGNKFELNGISAISSVYPGISCSEVNSYSSSFLKRKCGNSFAQPPPTREKERDRKSILDHATSSEYTTSDQSWDYYREEEDMINDKESCVSHITNKSKASPKTRKR